MIIGIIYDTNNQKSPKQPREKQKEIDHRRMAKVVKHVGGNVSPYTCYTNRRKRSKDATGSIRAIINIK